MTGRIFGIFTITAIICAIITGKTQELGVAAAEGAASAVTVTLGLIGSMALWSGIMRVFDAAGATERLARIASPLLGLIFPDAKRKGNGMREVTSAVTANMLGLGNAATPLSVAAMKALAANTEERGRASGEMITFAVLSTASLDLVPTTLLALRGAAGSASPEEILVPVWLCSAICAVAAVLSTKLAEGIAAMCSRLRTRSRSVRGERGPVC